jgi:hypothetical protein
MNRVYLDFNATTPVEPEVLDAMLPYFSGEFANAASIHTPGQKARAAVETAREKVAALIGARPPRDRLHQRWYGVRQSRDLRDCRRFNRRKGERSGSGRFGGKPSHRKRQARHYHRH